MAPVLESIATQQADNLRTYKVNADEHPELAARFEVIAVPTILVFHEGQLVRRMVGARGLAQLRKEIEESIRERRED